MFQSKIDKCGKIFCCISTINSQALLDYKNFIIKTIRLGDENQFISLWNRYVINDNIIIFTTFVDKKCKIYDVKQDKIIQDYTIDFIINYYRTSKVGNNLYYTFDVDYLYKWKYNFELNKVDILNKKNIKYLGKLDRCRIIND